jgi:hypothetical protein
MGFFRFRRSIKLFPGVRWNFGKKSSSLSIGGRLMHNWGFDLDEEELQEDNAPYREFLEGI